VVASFIAGGMIAFLLVVVVCPVSNFVDGDVVMVVVNKR
jgi:hypothetical protein